MKINEINPSIRDAIRELKKLDLPDGASALLTSITTAGNHLPDIAKAMDTREADNAKLREQVRDLEGQVPAGDSVVLPKAEADLLAAFQELRQFEEIKLKVSGFDEATATARKLKAEQLLDRASRDPEDETAYRYKPSVLQGVLKLHDAQLEAGKDGAFTVKHGDKTEALEAWLEANAGDFTPALTITTESTGKQASRQAGDRQHTDKKTGPTVEQRKANLAATGDYAI